MSARSSPVRPMTRARRPAVKVSASVFARRWTASSARGDGDRPAAIARRLRRTRCGGRALARCGRGVFRIIRLAARARRAPTTLSSRACRREAPPQSSGAPARRSPGCSPRRLTDPRDRICTSSQAPLSPVVHRQSPSMMKSSIRGSSVADGTPCSREPVSGAAGSADGHAPHRPGAHVGPGPQPYTASRTSVVKAPIMPSIAVLVRMTTLVRLTGSTNQAPP